MVVFYPSRITLTLFQAIPARDVPFAQSHSSFVAFILHGTIFFVIALPNKHTEKRRLIINHHSKHHPKAVDFMISIIYKCDRKNVYPSSHYKFLPLRLVAKRSSYYKALHPWQYPRLKYKLSKSIKI